MTALDTSTTLAFERTRSAYKRTMMAWIRTAASSLITFGFSAYRFFELEMKNVPVFNMLLGPCGFGPCIDRDRSSVSRSGVLEHGRELRTLRSRYPDMPRSMSGIVSLVVGALGLSYLVAALVRA